MMNKQSKNFKPEEILFVDTDGTVYLRPNVRRLNYPIEETEDSASLYNHYLLEKKLRQARDSENNH